MKTYSVTNPQMIIDLFESMSRKIYVSSEEAAVWREATDMIRNMEFIGWGPKDRGEYQETDDERFI